eukprot:3884070-Rhodomonas_salina.1
MSGTHLHDPESRLRSKMMEEEMEEDEEGEDEEEEDETPDNMKASPRYPPTRSLGDVRYWPRAWPHVQGGQMTEVDRIDRSVSLCLNVGGS